MASRLQLAINVTDLQAAISHFERLGFIDSIEKESTCCYAVQDKVWVHDPDGAPWEYYTVLADAQTMSAAPDGGCC